MVEQLAKSRDEIFLVFVASIIIICCVILSERILNLHLDYMIKNPIEIAKLPFYAGVLSTFGKMVWFGAMIICLLGAVLLKGTGPKFIFLLSSTFLTAWFVADDLLMLHEGFQLFLHIPEKVSYFIYILLIGIYFFSFLGFIFHETSYPLLALSFLFLGVSVITGINGTSNALIILIKGSLKFIGIAFWTGYFFSTVVHLLRK